MSNASPWAENPNSLFTLLILKVYVLDKRIKELEAGKAVLGDVTVDHENRLEDLENKQND